MKPENMQFLPKYQEMKLLAVYGPHFELVKGTKY